MNIKKRLCHITFKGIKHGENFSPFFVEPRLSGAGRGDPFPLEIKTKKRYVKTNKDQIIKISKNFKKRYVKTNKTIHEF